MSTATLTRAHALLDYQTPARIRLSRIRWQEETTARLDSFGIDRYGLDYYGTPDRDREGQWLDLAAEGWRVWIGITQDDEPYDPGDCHNVNEYPECKAGEENPFHDGRPSCGCFPEYVYGVVAEVYDPAEIERGSDALYGIDSDGTSESDLYVLAELLEVAEEACRYAGVNFAPAEVLP